MAISVTQQSPEYTESYHFLKASPDVGELDAVKHVLNNHRKLALPHRW